MSVRKKKPKPEIVFKMGVHRFNPDNLLGQESYDDAKDMLLVCLEHVNDKKTMRDKCSFLNTSLQFGLGKNITKKCFFDLLDYCDIEYEDWLGFMEDQKKILSKGIYDLDFRWFYALDEKWMR